MEQAHYEISYMEHDLNFGSVIKEIELGFMDQEAAMQKFAEWKKANQDKDVINACLKETRVAASFTF